MSSDELVEVPFEGKSQEKATLLLAAAEEEGIEASEVKTTTGAFLVPKSLADKAFGSEKSESPAKKAASKKSTAKKSQE